VSFAKHNIKKNNVIMRIVDYRKLDSIQPSEETKRIIQNETYNDFGDEDPDWINDLKDQPILYIRQDIFRFLVNIDIEQFKNDVKCLTAEIIGTTELHDPLVPEEFPTGEGKTWRTYRKKQEALRNAAIQLYKRCALCDINDPDMLVAAHIDKWSNNLAASGKIGNIIVCVYYITSYSMTTN
jgi:hypothetical protein